MASYAQCPCGTSENGPPADPPPAAGAASGPVSVVALRACFLAFFFLAFLAASAASACVAESASAPTRIQAIRLKSEPPTLDGWTNRRRAPNQPRARGDDRANDECLRFLAA